MESKYRWRKGERKCPACGKDTIIKGKAEYGGGWLCFAKKGGCGAKYGDDDPAITGQQVGRIDNPDVADVYNTVLKIAKKRAHVDAVLTATAASDIFAQDLEDLPAAVETVHAQSENPAPGSEIILTEDVKNDVHDKTLAYIQIGDAVKMRSLWKSFGADEQVLLSGMFDSAQRNRIKELITKGGKNAA